ncbi:hypothetical protein VHUM_00561 [Vanrija humicola]|uniref:Autophagy-related protein 3 n=1 Tax=Vanrija humicola TaxID=5417 RepID=A0A7D8Z3Y7_VANHU|nr:hypothetical protein VHUM_00561 [Vanrija humicola]
MNNSLLAIQSQYWAVRDYLSPVLRESKFKEHGRITPEEFVAAGDFLTFKFPVWQWEKGDANRARDFLPADKQYLICRNVPCLRRATALNYTDDDEDAEKLLNFLDEAEVADPDDEWVATHIGREAKASAITDIPDLDESPSLNAATANLHIGDDDEIPDMDDIPDMDEAAGLEEEDDSAAARPAPSSSSNLLQVRTYDCYISYDKHYQTPRFWLFGYDEHKTPLTTQQVFQDVPSDHAFKTMTMEAFPHSGTQLASVHPCKHASVMKKFIDRMEASQAEALEGGQSQSSQGSGKRRWLGGVVRKVTGGDKPAEKAKADADADETSGVQVDFYLVIFLKFIASIVPTIEVDSTTSF